MTPFALELLINLVLISLIFIFQIPKRILCLILNKISIYLPFNNSDLETIKKLKHEKNKESGIVRSCNLNEYISILKDDDNIFSSKAYSRIDMFLYFYSCIIIILLTIIIIMQYVLIIGIFVKEIQIVILIILGKNI